MLSFGVFFLVGLVLKKLEILKIWGNSNPLFCIVQNKNKGGKGFVLGVCVCAWYGVRACGVGGGGGVVVWGVAKS